MPRSILLKSAWSVRKNLEFSWYASFHMIHIPYRGAEFPSADPTYALFYSWCQGIVDGHTGAINWSRPVRFWGTIRNNWCFFRDKKYAKQGSDLIHAIGFVNIVRHTHLGRFLALWICKFRGNMGSLMEWRTYGCACLCVRNLVYMHT